MSGPDDIVREALASLLAAHPRAEVTDPGSIRALLETQLGPTFPDPALIDALVLATHTPVLRNLSDDARPDTTEAQLESALRKLGVGDAYAASAAARWSEVLLPAARARAGTPTAPPRSTPPVNAGAPVAATPSATAGPASPAPDPRPARPRPAWLEAPGDEPEHDPQPPTRPQAPVPPAAPPAASAPTTAVPPANPPRHAAAPVTSAGSLGGGPNDRGRDRDGGDERGWPGSAKTVAAILAVLAVIIGAVAFVGWTRDPSKDRASSAESEVTKLGNDLASAKQATVDANVATAAAKATIGERDGQLAAAKDQITKMATVTRAQLNGARFPETFAMSGKVAPGSCSLTGEACNVTAIVRSIKITCATKPCECTTGSCTVTSELWRTASPVTFDPATNLFNAKGLLDGDVFRCAGVAQPTTFDFRFRVVSWVGFDEGVWKVTGVEAELAETSAAAAECLAGNRTYTLGGPTA